MRRLLLSGAGLGALCLGCVAHAQAVDADTIIVTGEKTDRKRVPSGAHAQIDRVERGAHHAHNQRRMQQGERRIEHRAEANVDARHRRQHDRRVAEDHAEDEAHAERVQGDVVRCVGLRGADPCSACDAQPTVTDQQADGGVAA